MVVFLNNITPTLFENYQKCHIWIFEFYHFPTIFWLLKKWLFDRKFQLFKTSPKLDLFWHFPSNFVQLKVTYLVTLFDRKFQLVKNSPKLDHFWAFSTNFCLVKNVYVARFARNVEWDFFLWFSNTMLVVWGLRMQVHYKAYPKVIWKLQINFWAQKKLE